MKYEAVRLTIRGTSVFSFGRVMLLTIGCRGSPDAKHGIVLLEKSSLQIANALCTYQLRDQRLMVIALRSIIVPLQGSANVLSTSGLWQWL